MPPEAPARLSTMTGWPVSLVTTAPKARARPSVVLPGAEPMRMVIGLLGNVCAPAAPQASAAA